MKTEVEKVTLGIQLESSTSGRLEKVSWGTQSREGASRKEDSTCANSTLCPGVDYPCRLSCIWERVSEGVLITSLLLW